MNCSDKRQATSDRTSGALRAGVATLLLPVACCMLLIASSWPPVAEAAVSKGTDRQLEAGGTNQGGGATTSSNFRQQATIGEAITSNQISSSRFRVLPGFLAAALSAITAAPVSDLNIEVLYAKTDPLGSDIASKTWQQDKDPIFLWESPATGLDVVGYSYAIDGEPDNVADTAQTSLNIATSPLKELADGKHTFSIKAVNSAGNAGNTVSFELWIDTAAPQILTYGPSTGSLLSTLKPSVSATIADLGSGASESTIRFLVNGAAASLLYDGATGVMTSTGGAWREGANSLELRVADTVGNAQAPLIWSLTVDTTPPRGSVTVNADAAMTTSVYVTLGLQASDAISGVTRVLISNEELAGYVDEPYVALRELWKLTPVRGPQKVFVKFADRAGNVSLPIFDEIDLALLSPETVITSGPAGFTPAHAATFMVMCPEGDCLFSYAFDGDAWSAWSANISPMKDGLALGNHYFRVKAARDVNGTPDIQVDEEDPSPAERMWIVGVEPSMLAIPKGPPIKVWRIE